MKHLNAGVMMVLAGVVFLPGAASAQAAIIQRCAVDSLEVSQAEARLEWMRRCALAKGTGGAFDTGAISSSGGMLMDYSETSPDPWSGLNMYTGPSDMGDINGTYINKLYNSGGTYQGTDAQGFYKWWRTALRKKVLPLYPMYGSLFDINSASNRQLFPHPTLATCGFYFDRNGTQPAPASQSFYLNGFCESMGSPAAALTSGVPLSVSGTAGSSQYYTMNVPAGAASVAFETSGGTGDVDLYVRHNAIPETTLYDCRPYVNGSNELCNMPTPAAGTWRVMLRGYTNYSGVTLKSFIYNGLTDGVPSAAVSGAQGSEQYWVLQVPAGMSRLTVTLAGVAGSTGNADLYVRNMLAPILTAYDCRPYMGGNSEVCTFNAPAGGTWYVMVRGWSAYSGVTVTGDYY